MKKLELNIDRLAVESFETDPTVRELGTVHGADASAPNPCLPDTAFTCPRRQTLYNSCVANCECTNGVRACLGPQTTNC